MMKHGAWLLFFIWQTEPQEPAAAEGTEIIKQSKHSLVRRSWKLRAETN